MTGKRNRVKGHNLEREEARWWRSIGFNHCKTTRESSRLLDGCGVDLDHIPVLQQCKAGYENSYPKYDQIYQYIKEKLKENYPKDDPIHHAPIILTHKLDGAGKRHPERYYYSIDHKFARELLEFYFKHKDEYV